MGSVRYGSRTIPGEFADNSAGSGGIRSGWPVTSQGAIPPIGLPHMRRRLLRVHYDHTP